MNEREAFLKALAENEDDTTTRLVYADWLEERGEHEEADRQRKWPAAKQWFVKFCQDYCSRGDDALDNEDPDGDNPYSYFHIPLANLLKLGRKAFEQADEGRIHFYCGANEEMMDALRANTQEFWENWSVMTGIPLPPGVEEKSSFSCSC
jgi:uncharacterized protein (TIGR02996 family)